MSFMRPIGDFVSLMSTALQAAEDWRLGRQVRAEMLALGTQEAEHLAPGQSCAEGLCDAYIGEWLREHVGPILEKAAADAMKRNPTTPTSTVHDYRSSVCTWGHDYVYIPQGDGYTGNMSGWGLGIKTGDYIIVSAPKNENGVAFYRVDKITYYKDPGDMWRADISWVSISRAPLNIVADTMKLLGKQQ